MHEEAVAGLRGVGQPLHPVHDVRRGGRAVEPVIQQDAHAIGALLEALFHQPVLHGFHVIVAPSELGVGARIIDPHEKGLRLASASRVDQLRFVVQVFDAARAQLRYLVELLFLHHDVHLLKDFDPSGVLIFFVVQNGQERVGACSAGATWPSIGRQIEGRDVKHICRSLIVLAPGEHDHIGLDGFLHGLRIVVRHLKLPKVIPG
mmetsp:Transcript_6964/g.12041  ORF Transcript_6964/g.12041 Transcript_6964/m.12041 type:complete len:205 (+) Transcript_6964:601-1215(+)